MNCHIVIIAPTFITSQPKKYFFFFNNKTFFHLPGPHEDFRGYYPKLVRIFTNFLAVFIITDAILFYLAHY